MLQAISTLVGGVVLVAVGVADAWTRQRFGLPLDTALVLGGAAALGVHIASNDATK